MNLFLGYEFQTVLTSVSTSEFFSYFRRSRYCIVNFGCNSHFRCVRYSVLTFVEVLVFGKVHWSKVTSEYTSLVSVRSVTQHLFLSQSGLEMCDSRRVRPVILSGVSASGLRYSNQFLSLLSNVSYCQLVADLWRPCP